MGDQLSIFNEEPRNEGDSNSESSPLCDKLMNFLEEMNRDAEEQNRKLQAMIEEIQSGWSEDEKLQINDPKEYERQQKLKPKEEPMSKELTTEAIETLKNSKVEGLTVKLPEGQLDRNIYLEVKGRLELIGGKWKGGKVSGFVFQEDPTELLEQIANGENRNLKKEFQFFATPDDLADELVRLAEITIKDRVLEPSAGQGAIVKAINRVIPDLIVECCEVMPLNQTILRKIETAAFACEDFLLLEDPLGYDKIIANPPFSKNQDIEHIYKMYSLLKSGGRLVSIASKHWQFASNKKETSFRQFIEENGEVIEIEAGRFKDSGTTIATCIIIINKP